jgi:hypothetical protein
MTCYALCHPFKIAEAVMEFLEPLKKDLLKKSLVAVQLGKGVKKNFIYAHFVGSHR